MPRVLISQWIFGEAVDMLRNAGHAVTTTDDDSPMGSDALGSALAGHDALVCMLTDRVDAALLGANPQLRVVANVAVGHDNIDVDAAVALGITVTNTPDVLTEATADLTFALLLAAARRIPEADAHVRDGRWRSWQLVQPQTGSDVHGRRLGIVGMGRIGQAVARRAARGFGMEVVYHQRRGLPREAEAAIPARRVTFDELLTTSDVVSLHAPATAETRHLIGSDELRRMPAHAILVNTARGTLVDESALADALDRGEIAGVGLDVFEDEPHVHPGLIGQRSRVVLAPHIGSATVQTRRRMAEVAARNVIAVLRGDAAPNPVVPPSPTD